MEKRFKNHIVICGWNARGKKIVSSLQAMSERPIFVVHSQIETLCDELRSFQNVFVVAGDCRRPEVLMSLDVETAHAVLVLSRSDHGLETDAHSMEIALAVEKINSAIYTVVEVRDIRNKAHFSWTKVDDIVADQRIAVSMLAQSARHILAHRSRHSPTASGPAFEKRLTDSYFQLVDPHHQNAQIFRLDFKIDEIGHLRFSQIFQAGVGVGLLPVGLVGYRRVIASNQPQGRTSWKTDMLSNPSSKVNIAKLWDGWPQADVPVGVLLLSKSIEHARKLIPALENLG